MKRNTERLAWIVLLASFFTCVSLAVLTPLSIRWYIRKSRVVQPVRLEVPRPPLSVTLSGRGQPVSLSEHRDDIPEGTIIKSNATSGRLVVHPPQGRAEPPVATVQIYDGTELALSSARSPRFSVSHLPHRTVLDMKSGRVYINIPGSPGRPTVVEVHTPHGEMSFREGRYTVEADQEQAYVLVQEGLASLTCEDDSIPSLGVGECAVMDRTGEIIGPISSTHNFITNGDFQNSLNAWSVEINQNRNPPGSLDILKDDEWHMARFYRDGVDHAEVILRQEINQDPRQFTSLKLHLVMQIRHQNIPVCGTRGSECPLMVRIAYQDAHGAEREWLQGFYALANLGGSKNPHVCETCGTRNPHIQVQGNSWYPYLSLNLIPQLSVDGRAPTMIKSLTIYASGHSFESMVTEVALIGQE